MSARTACLVSYSLTLPLQNITTNHKTDFTSFAYLQIHETGNSFAGHCELGYQHNVLSKIQTLINYNTFEFLEH
jgi:hypothetical protein